MNDTPRPFTVSATISLGRSRTPRRDFSVFASAARSWPSQRTACHPNAVTLATKSPRSLTEETHVSDWILL